MKNNYLYHDCFCALEVMDDGNVAYYNAFGDFATISIKAGQLIASRMKENADKGLKLLDAFLEKRYRK